MPKSARGYAEHSPLEATKHAGEDTGSASTRDALRGRRIPNGMVQTYD